MPPATRPEWRGAHWRPNANRSARPAATLGRSLAILDWQVVIARHDAGIRYLPAIYAGPDTLASSARPDPSISG